LLVILLEWAAKTEVELHFYRALTRYQARTAALKRLLESLSHGRHRGT
jgi:hypothetical protein